GPASPPRRDPGRRPRRSRVAPRPRAARRPRALTGRPVGGPPPAGPPGIAQFLHAEGYTLAGARPCRRRRRTAESSDRTGSSPPGTRLAPRKSVSEPETATCGVEHTVRQRRPRGKGGEVRDDDAAR